MKTEAHHYAFGERRYGMKKHNATHLHYDLRLELNGFLLSWVLSEGPSCRAGVIREAIEMEDHKRANLPFEGEHETGTIMLWDYGTWEPYPQSEDVEKSFREGILRFTLHGEKLKGGWTLTKTNTTKNMRPVWTLCKHADAFAENHASRSILEERPNSISTGRTMEGITQDWKNPKDKHQGQMRLFSEA